MECPHHSGYACPDQTMPHRQENRLPKPRKRNTNQFRTARLISAILDEPGDNPDNPGDVRMEQARQLLSLWNDAQGSLIGVLSEVVVLKAGFCVRCPTTPCSICGSDEYSIKF